MTIGATDVRRKFGEVVQRIYSGDKHFVVEKGGLPVVAIISMAEYAELMQARDHHETGRTERLQRFEDAARTLGEEVERRGLTEEDLETMIEATRQRLHEELEQWSG